MEETCVVTSLSHCRHVVVTFHHGLLSPQRGSVCVKAYNSLLLLSGLQSGSSGEILSHQTQLGELLAGRLLELYSLLPLESLDSGQVQSWSHTSWRYMYTLSTGLSGHRGAEGSTASTSDSSGVCTDRMVMLVL